MIFSIAAKGNSFLDIKITYFSPFFVLKAISGVFLESRVIYKVYVDFFYIIGFQLKTKP